MDSDGDGRTNGVELGDPDCVWVEGDEPAQPAQSHPGIVDEPVGEVADSCADYVAPDDLITLDISFTNPNSLDGNDRTEYICEQKTISSPSTFSSAFHAVRTSVINDNPNLLHHIWVYACDGVDSSDGNKVGQGSYSCSGIEGNCGIVAGWAVGARDFCEPANVGSYVDFGPAGTNKVFKIEAHYDNARMEASTDQSGMRLHLTPTLRPLNNNMVILGMDYWDREFVIPPLSTSYSLTNVCPMEATQAIGEAIYAYSWNPHMHYYGVSLVTEHYRCGRKIGELGRIDQYDFNNQQSYLFADPIKILPGDSLVTTCTYDTSTVNAGPVLGGEETTDEMCDNYLMYYPYVGTNRKPNFFTACSSFDSGLNPIYAGYDDRTPFVTLDLQGADFLYDYTADPLQAVPNCCSANDDGATCAQNYISDLGGPCGVDDDCLGDQVCGGGICEVNTNSGGDNGGDIDDSDGCPPCDDGSGRVKMFHQRYFCWEVCDEPNPVHAREAYGFQSGVCNNS